MAYRSFRQFLDALEKAGELKRVSIPVDTELLIAEWADREMKSPFGGKALLFEQPIVAGKISEFPVAINTMGSRSRMAMALQVSDIEDVARELQKKGVKFEIFGFFKPDELGIWTAPTGDKVAWFEDPDGNVLSVSEHV